MPHPIHPILGNWWDTARKAIANRGRAGPPALVQQTVDVNEVPCRVHLATTTTFSRILMKTNLLKDRDPCSLSGFIHDVLERNSQLYALHIRLRRHDKEHLNRGLAAAIPTSPSYTAPLYMNSILQPPHILFASTQNAKKFKKQEWHPTIVKREEYYATVHDPKFQGPVLSLATRTGLEWYFVVLGLTQPLCYLGAGAMVFPYQSPPWCLGTSDTLKQLTQEAVVSCNMEL